MISDVTPEEFVRIWQSAKSVGEVAERTGASKSAINIRAARYRRNGVALKYFRPPKINWEELAEVAASALEEEV